MAKVNVQKVGKHTLSPQTETAKIMAKCMGMGRVKVPGTVKLSSTAVG